LDHPGNFCIADPALLDRVGMPGMRNSDHGGTQGMKRWLFNIVCGLSLLLLVATVALWVQSCSKPAVIYCKNGSFAVASIRGECCLLAPVICHDLGWPSPSDNELVEQFGSAAVSDNDLWFPTNIQARVLDRWVREQCRVLPLGIAIPRNLVPFPPSCVVPYWVLSSLLAIKPIWSLARWRKTRRGVRAAAAFPVAVAAPQQSKQTG